MAVNILPIAGDDIVNSSEQNAVIVSGTAATASSNVVVTFTQGASSTIVNTTAAADGTWKAPGANLFTFAESPVPAQTNKNITVTVNDGTGAVTRTIGKDTIAPLPQLPNAVGGDDVVTTGEAGNVSVSGTGAEPNQFVTTAYIQGAVVKQVSVQADATGKFNTSGAPVNLLAAPPFVQGAASVIAISSDAAGNTGSSSRAFTIDLTAPAAPTINTPITADNVVNATEATQVVISGTSPAPNQPVLVEFLDGTNLLAAPIIIAGANGQYSLPAAGFNITALNDGQITVRVSSLPSNGTPTSTTTTFTLDKTPPAVQITTPTAGTTINLTGIAPAVPATNVIVTGTGAQPNTNVTITFAGGGGNTVTRTVLAAADGTYNLNPGANITALPDGPVTITVTSTDPVGNVGSAQRVLNKDTSTPVILITTPIAGNDIVSIAEGSALVITGTGADAGGVVTVTVTQLVPTNIVRTVSAVANANGVFTALFNLSAAPAFSEGAVTVMASFTDNANNTSTNQRGVFYDTSIPAGAVSILGATDDFAPLLLAPTNRSITNDTTLTFTGTTTAANGTIISVKANGTEVATAVVNGTAWTATTSVLPAGVYNFTATLRDNAPNEGAVSSPFGPITVDTVPPVVTINSPITSDNLVTLAEANALVVSGTTDAPNGTVTVTFSIGANSVTRTVAATGNNWTLAANPANIVGLPDGVILVQATAQDLAGNVGIATTTFTKQANPPAIVITSPIENDNRINAAEAADVLIQGTGAAANRPVTVTFTGSPTGSASRTVTADAAGGFTLLGNEVDLSGFSQGDVKIQVTSTDTLGNTGSASAIVPLDTIRPAIVIGAPLNNTALNATQLTQVIVTGSGAEPNSLVTITFNDTGVNAGTTQPVVRNVTANANGVYALVLGAAAPGNEANIAGLLDGQIDLTATSTDAFGNTGTANIVLFKDTQGPLIFIDTVAADNVINAAESLNVRVSGLAGDGATGSGVPSVTITIVGLDVNNVAISQTRTAPVVNGAFANDGNLFNLANFMDGALTITVTGADRAGNQSTATRNVVLDRNAPSLTITTPVMGDNRIGANEVANVQINGIGAFPNSNVLITFSDGVNSVTRNVTSVGTNFTTTADLTALADGQIVITVRNTDAAGNIGLTSATVAKDTGVPTITIAPITGDNFVNNSEKNGVIVSGTVTDTAGINVGSVVTLTFRKAGSADVVATATVTGANTYATAPFSIASITDGTVVVTAEVTDLAGNKGTAKVNVELDTVPPVLTLANSGFSGDGTLNRRELVGSDDARRVTGTTTPFASVSIQIVGSNGVTIGPFSVPADGNGSFNRVFTTAQLQTLANATLTGTTPAANIIVTAVDFAGNVTNLTRAINTIDTVLPILAVTGTNFDNLPAAPATTGTNLGLISIQESNAVTISGTISDANPNAGLLTGRQVAVTFIDVNNSPATGDIVGFGTATVLTVDANNVPLTYAFTVDKLGNGNPINISGLNEGGINVDVRFTDVAGNPIALSGADEAAIRFTATLDETAPTAAATIINATNASGGAATSPTTLNNLASTNHTSFTLNGTYDAAQSSTVTISGLPGGDRLATLNAAAGTWTLATGLLPNGTYQMIARARDAAGNPAPDSGQFQITVDTLPPSIILNVIGGDGIINENEAPGLVINGKGAQPNLPVEIKIQQAGGPERILAGVFANAIGDYQAIVDVRVGANLSLNAPFAVPLADAATANITVTATSRDQADNAGVATRTASKDTAPTTLSITGPIAGNDVVSAAEDDVVTVEGINATPNTSVVVTFTSGPTTQVKTVVADATGKYTLAAIPALGIPSNDGNLSNFPDGPVTVTANNIDAAGNLATATRVITIDRVAPNITITAPIMTDNAVNMFESPVFIVAGAGADPNRPVTIQVTDSQNTVVTINGVVADAKGEFTIAAPGFNLNSTALVDGNLTVKASSTDLGDNTGSATRALIMDRTAPVATINTPIELDNRINAGEVTTVEISGTGAEPSGNVEITFLDSANPANKVVKNVTAQVGGNYSLALNPANLTGLVDGAITVQVKAVDAVGNFILPNHPALLKDTVIRAIQINAPIMGDDVINAAEQNSVNVTGTNAEPNAIVTVSLDDNNAATPAVVRTVTADAAGNFTLATNLAGISTLNDGQITVTASNSDAAGNTSNASRSVTKDSSIPGLTINTPIAGGPQTPGISGYVTDGERTAGFTISGIGATPNSTVTVSLIGVGASRLFNVTSTATGTWVTPSIDLRSSGGLAFGDGFITVSASNADPSGNVSTDVDTIVLDTAAPNIVRLANWNGANAPALATVFALTYPPVPTPPATLPDPRMPTNLPANSFVVLRDVGATAYILDQIVNGPTIFVNDNTLVVVGQISDGTSASNPAAANTLVGNTVTVRNGGTTLGTAVVNENGRFIFEIPAQATGTALEINVLITDLAGNVSAGTGSNTTGANSGLDNGLTITIDSAAPVLSINPIAGNDFINAAEVAAVVITGTTNTNGIPVSVIITQGNLVVNEITTAAAGAFTVTANLSGFAQGGITVTAVSTDLGNNTGQATRSTAVIDTVAPLLAVTTIAGNDVINAAEAPGVVVTGTRDDLPVTVTATSGNQTVTATANANGTANYTVTLPSIVAFPDGPVTITAQSTDPAGNVTTVTRVVVKETTVPAVTVNTPITSDNVINASEQAAVPVSGNGAEPGLNVKITFRDVNNNSVAVNTAAGPTGAYSIIAPTVANISSLVDGTITVIVESTDPFGNVGTATTTAIKDTTGPVVTTNLLTITTQVTTLTTGVLNAVDAVSPAANVTYIVTNAPQSGFLALTSAPQVPISTFSQAQVNAGQVLYTQTIANAFDAVQFVATDAVGNATSGRLDIQLQNVTVPRVESVVINDGNATRSSLKKLTVTFNTVVQIDAGAFVVQRRDDIAGAPITIGNVPAAQTNVGAPAVVAGKTVVSITFLPTVAPSSPATTFVDSAGSLIDGNYRLEIDATKVRSQAGLFALDGDNNGAPGGNFVYGNQAVDKFYRLYGDTDGSTIVDLTDLNALVIALTSGNYREDLDKNGDNFVDFTDLNAFLQNFNASRNLNGF